MARWEGFTEEDIRKVSSSERLVEAQPQPPRIIRVAKRQANITQYSGQKNVTRSRMLQKSHHSVESNNAEKMPQEAFLVKQKVSADGDAKCKNETNPTATEMSSDSGCVSSNTGSPIASDTTTPNTSPSHGTVCLRIKEGRSYEVLSAADKNSTLDEFQSRQRLMEEQNRQRRELLSKAIADKKKQTTAEARRLQHIQEELQKLDAMLSNDVSILRDQIEVASHEFMEAQKRYNKAEKEFIDAKLRLFDKLERKELLTEHLCTIIEQNEIRKARKLSELMDKLHLGVTTTDMCEDNSKNAAGNVILSPLCALDEVSYSLCNTIKPRKAVENSDGITSSETNNADTLDAHNVQISANRNDLPQESADENKAGDIVENCESNESVETKQQN